MRIGILDIETTNFLGQHGLIVEVGIAALDTETQEIDTVFGSICQEPGFDPNDETPWIFNNSSLTAAAVSKAPMLSELKGVIEHHLKGFDFVTAFNKSFDFDFMRDRRIAIGLEFPCIMKSAVNVCKLPGKGSGYKWPNVEEAWKVLMPTIPYIEKHRGPDDAAHEAVILRELIRRGAIKVPDLVASVPFSA